MRYVLRRKEDNAFVAPDGSKNAYTRELQSARTFPSKEAAEADACGNEYAISVDKVMQ